MVVSLPLLVLVIGTAPAPSPTPCTPPAISAKALALLRPVLSAYQEADEGTDDTSGPPDAEERRWQAYEERFFQLLSNRGSAASEAIAALMCFYVGEHPAEELMCEAVTRGAKITVYLKRFRNCPPRTGLPFFDRSPADIPNFREKALALIAAKQPPPCN